MAKNRSKNRIKDPSGKDVPRSIRSYARLLDSKYSVGNFRFGIDPLIGLIPGIGDFLAVFLSGGLIAMAAREGASGKVIVLMSLNALLDATIGSIPILGGIFDFFYKANNRNVRILERHFREGKYRGSGKGLLVIILVVFLALAVLIIYGTWELITYLLALI